MTNHFTNTDSLWLQKLAEDLATVTNHKGEQHSIAQITVRLLLIAQQVQFLDELNQTLSNNRSYSDGYAAAEAAMRRRSNVLVNHGGENAHSASTLDQINRRVAEGNLKRIALGERALEDKPHEFNAPTHRKPQATKPLPKVALDLSFLEEL